MGVVRRIFIILFVSAIACRSSAETEKNFDNQLWNIIVLTTHGSSSLRCEVAHSHQKQLRGLMFRKHLADNGCMIFVYQSETPLSFWMKNTYIPLDIAFVKSDQTLLEVKSMKPLDETTVRSSEPVMYAIEANAGWFKRNGALINRKVTIIKNQ